MKQEPISCRADNALTARCRSLAARWVCVLKRPIFYLAAYIDNNIIVMIIIIFIISHPSKFSTIQGLKKIGTCCLGLLSAFIISKNRFVSDSVAIGIANLTICPKWKKNTPVQVQVIPDKLPSQFKIQYFQRLFENENNYGLTSCPSGKIAEIKGRIGSFILLRHEKEVIYMLI